MPTPRAAATAVPASAAHAVLRSRHEDFAVEELPKFLPDGEGEHLWLQLRKRGVTSGEVAVALARHWRVKPPDVGYAGRKDRHAECVQWFSVRLPGREPGPLPELPGVIWLDQRRHTRKLATGALLGNRFRLVLREFSGDRQELEARLERVRVAGVPNYFGAQRFGHQGGNLPRAWRMLVEGQPVRQRDLQGLLYSAARSWCFNRVLSTRVEDGSWRRLLAGELAGLHGSRSVFTVEHPDDASLAARLAAGDIHPSGPLPGRGGPVASGACAALEQEALAALAPLVAGLAQARVEAGRRALRVQPQALAWDWPAPDCLELAFELPSGAYATSVLRELLAARDASGADLAVPA